MYNKNNSDKTNIGDKVVTGYKIKNINNEEVLYVYLDFNYEFGSLKSQNSNIKKEIKKFLEKNKIAFKGTLVALVVGGMVTGSMKIKPSNEKNNLDNEKVFSINSIEKRDVSDNVIVSNNDVTIESKIDETPIEETIDDEPIVEQSINNHNEIVDKQQEIISVQNELIISNDVQEVVTPNEKVQERQEEKVEEVNEVQEAYDDSIYVNLRRSNGEYETIELEEYVIGVVGAEMPASFQIEAIKSQAIIARTYALKAIERGQVLTDTESTQSYKDNNALRNLWGSSFDIYYNKIKDAVISTSGMVLTYNGQYIEAVYHSTSNGVTEAAVNVWGNSFPYLISVDSIYDNTNPSFIKDKFFSYNELSRILNMDINKDTNFNITGFTSGNRIENIEVNGINYKGTTFRQLLGLRSADFSLSFNEDGITFTTKGYGHGVGLSQYGANGMAKNGYSYIEILKHYYPGVIIE